MICYNGVRVTRQNAHAFPEYIQKAFALEVMNVLYSHEENTDIIQAWEREFFTDMKRRRIDVVTVRVPDIVRGRLDGRFCFAVE